MGSLPCESQGDRFPDSTSCTGNQHDFAFKFHVVTIFNEILLSDTTLSLANNLRYRTALPEGPDFELYNVKSENTVVKLEEVVTRWVNNGFCRVDRILILSPHGTKAKTSLPPVPKSADRHLLVAWLESRGNCHSFQLAKPRDRIIRCDYDRRAEHRQYYPRAGTDGLQPCADARLQDVTAGVRHSGRRVLLPCMQIILPQQLGRFLYKGRFA